MSRVRLGRAGNIARVRFVPSVGPRPGGRCGGTIARVVGAAFLRVFLPLEALPDEERNRIERWLLSGRRAPSEPVYRHLTPSRESVGLLEMTEERSDVRSRDGRWYACPSRNRLRVLAAMVALRESVPAEVADLLVPEADARRAARELARARRRDPGAVPAMLESSWHIPVRWFVLFDGDDRWIAERPDGGYTVRYWTPIREARRRAAWAAGILEAADLGPVAAMVTELDEWLASFDVSSAVELDYGGVAEGSGWNDLDDDHSATEIREALQSLEAGDVDRSAELYRSVAGRWAEARIRESLN